MKTTRARPARKIAAKKTVRKKVATKGAKKAAAKKAPSKKKAITKLAGSGGRAKSFPAARGVSVFSSGRSKSPTRHHFEPAASGKTIASAVGVTPAPRSSLRQLITGLASKGVLKGYIK